MGAVIRLPVPSREDIEPPRPAVLPLREDERRRHLRDRLELTSRTLRMMEWEAGLLAKAVTEATCLLERDPDALDDPTLAELWRDYSRAMVTSIALRGVDPRHALEEAVRSVGLDPRRYLDD
jgi:hypothetical protein